MIDVKTAVRKAVEYVRELQDYFPQGDIRLEETEFVDPDLWQITLSFDNNGSFLGSMAGRRFKIFRIDAETGEVESMKIRTLEPAR
jgi:hypothetical protein